MSAIHQVLLAGGGGYQIANSLRFRASNSAYLSWTTGSAASDRKYATVSIWLKRGALTGRNAIYAVNPAGASGASNQITMIFDNAGSNGDNITYNNGSVNRTTTSVYRDPSAHLHFHQVFDTTQATAADRVKTAINGVILTDINIGQDFSLNSNTPFGQASITEYIGRRDSGLYFDGLMAEIIILVGQALPASSFGQTDATTGVWVPKAYSGTFGSLDRYYKFADASAATAAAIGKDSSGNGLNATPSGISVTAGTTFDQMTDTPTNNYSTFDAISPIGSASSIGTLASASLTFDHSAANYAQRFGSFAVASGKWYFEYTITTFSSGRSCAFGIGKTADYPSGAGAAGSWTGCVGYGDFGDTYLRPITEAAGVSNTSGVASMTFAVNDVLMIAFDVDAGKFWMGKNGTWFDSGNPAAGTNQKQTFTTGINWRPWCVQYGSSAAQSVANFGQRAFSYTPPSGFKSLSTANITSTAVSTSGSFTGNAAADGPFVWTNGNPATLTINGNPVTFGTHADKTAGGFKLRSSSASYNASGSNSWTATAGKRFVQVKKPNNAQVNP